MPVGLGLWELDGRAGVGIAFAAFAAAGRISKRDVEVEVSGRHHSPSSVLAGLDCELRRRTGNKVYARPRWP